MNDRIKENLKKFRLESGLTSDQVAQISGVSVDNLRRYEGGGSGVPSEVLHKLAGIYGHSMEDFFMEHPPEPDLASRPAFHLRTLPGVEIDEKKFRELQEIVNRANEAVRPKRAKKPTVK